MRTGAESRRTPELRHDEEEDPIWKCSEPKRTEDRYRSSLPKIATEARFCWPVKKLHKRVSRAGECTNVLAELEREYLVISEFAQ